jgi:hypothetical protein
MMEQQLKRSRELEDVVVHARLNARRFMFDLLSASYVMHVMTHTWEEKYCNGVDNRTDSPLPDYCERLVDYWLHYDLLPAPEDELVFSNKYDYGVLQSKPLRCPRALPTDGTLLQQAKAKKGKF